MDSQYRWAREYVSAAKRRAFRGRLEQRRERRVALLALELRAYELVQRRRGARRL